MPFDRPVTARRHLAVLPAVTLVAALVVALVATLLVALPGTALAPSAAPAPAAAHAEGVSAVPHTAAVKAKKAGKAKKKATKKAKRGKHAHAVVHAAPVEWAGTTLRYHNALPEQWDWSVQTAVAQWNATGAGPRLVPVSDPAAAQVRISYGDIGASAGLATVGRTAGAYVKLNKRYATEVYDQYSRVEVMAVLTHELGHVYGLDHTTTPCTLMGPTMDIVGCGIYDMAAPDLYRCDVIGAAPAQLMARRYGTTAATPPAGSCALPAAPAPQQSDPQPQPAP